MVSPKTDAVYEKKDTENRFYYCFIFIANITRYTYIVNKVEPTLPRTGLNL